MLLAAAAPAADPGLPYQAIGVVLAALVTGITAIVVAILQRQRNAPTTPPAPPPAPGSGGYAVSESDWIDTRNRAIRAEAAVEALRHEYNQHEQISQEHMGRTNGKIELLERRLGGPIL